MNSLVTAMSARSLTLLYFVFQISTMFQSMPGRLKYCSLSGLNSLYNVAIYAMRLSESTMFY